MAERLDYEAIKARTKELKAKWPTPKDFEKHYRALMAEGKITFSEYEDHRIEYLAHILGEPMFKNR